MADDLCPLLGAAKWAKWAARPARESGAETCRGQIARKVFHFMTGRRGSSARRPPGHLCAFAGGQNWARNQQTVGRLARLCCVQLDPLDLCPSWAGRGFRRRVARKLMTGRQNQICAPRSAARARARPAASKFRRLRRLSRPRVGQQVSLDAASAHCRQRQSIKRLALLARRPVAEPSPLVELQSGSPSNSIMLIHFGARNSSQAASGATLARVGRAHWRERWPATNLRLRQGERAIKPAQVDWSVRRPDWMWPPSWIRKPGSCATTLERRARALLRQTSERQVCRRPSNRRLLCVHPSSVYRFPRKQPPASVALVRQPARLLGGSGGRCS